jgi:hypothetical protein
MKASWTLAAAATVAAIVLGFFVAYGNVTDRWLLAGWALVSTGVAVGAILVASLYPWVGRRRP